MKIYEAMGAKAIDKKDPRRQEKINAMFQDPSFIGQRKLDGERILIHKDTDENETIRIFGRGTGKYGDRKEKTQLLPHIVSAMQFLPGGTVLDGEILYIPPIYTTDEIKALDFKEHFWKCREIMGSYPEKAIPQQQREGWLHFFAFDCLMLFGMEIDKLPYRQRIGELYRAFEDFIGWGQEHIHYLPVVKGKEAKMNLLETSLELGLEGILLKNLNGTYSEGKKPTNQWVKIKQEHEADCVVMGYSAPNQFTERQLDGKPMLDEQGQPVLMESKYFLNNWIGALWVGQFIPKDQVTKEHLDRFRQMDFGPFISCAEEEIDGETYTLMPVAKVSGIDEATRHDISTNMPEYLEKVVKINYFDRTEDSYFQPRINCFREDKPVKECVWE